ncbi:MAG: hypothetical protein EOL87_05350 [Spartobacteria bacterium]|nr:hypothetical protein [Spartobacteria bacterium]
MKKDGIFFGLIVTLFMTLVLSVIITWPLPQYASRGIAASHRPEQGGPRAMIPGDHLQLMYFYQLMDGFISGETPWLHNLYEFNEGDDAARYEPDFYYMPFSLLFTAGAVTGNFAVAWNLTGFIAFWMTAFGTWLLLRRFASSRWLLLAGAAVSIMLPYRWITFLQGSPTGVGMTYVPFILWGLDIAIRDGRARGGAISGLCLLLSGWCDMHTFFFSALLTPFWCIFCYLYDGVDFSWRRIGRTIVSMIPFVTFIGLVGLQAWLVHALLQDASSSQTGRTIGEVLLFSPRSNGFFGMDPQGLSAILYLSISIAAVFILGFAAWGRRLLDHPSAVTVGRFVLYLLLLVGVGGVLLLSLGPNMFSHGDLWWERLCKVIPPYAMIRQPAKIFTILPTLLAVLLVLPFAELSEKRTWPVFLLSLLFIGGMVTETSLRIDPTICLLDYKQDAYAAVKRDAHHMAETARAVAVPLWPGDTHWSSIYQYYGATYAVRMLNGYSPNVTGRYINDIFMRFEGLNRGYVSDELLDDLLSRGIDHLIVHEDAFPEKVSPFGVSQTLSQFLAHPRIKLLKQEQAVWAFAIVAEPNNKNIIHTGWDIDSPTLRWDLEREQMTHAEVIDDPSHVHGHGYARLNQSDSAVLIGETELFYRPTLRLSIRVRGHGTADIDIAINGETARHSTRIDSDEWIWLDVPFPAFSGFQRHIAMTLRSPEGRIDADYAYIGMGRTLSDIQPGETIHIPAPSLFHAGYSSLEDNSVTLLPHYTAADHVVYGPRLPLPVGIYRFVFHQRTEPGLTNLAGTIQFRYPGDIANPDSTEVYANQPDTSVPFIQTDNLPVTWDFRYTRKVPVIMTGLDVIRLK